MKKKIIAIVSTVCLVYTLGAVSFVSALDKGRDKFTINAQHDHADIIHKKDKKKVPDFPHHAHQDKHVKGKQGVSNFKFTDDWTCGACHHTTKKGEQPGSCLKCKDLNKMLDKVGGAKKFEKIYHSNCRDACHKKTDKKMAKCKFCHKKKK